MNRSIVLTGIALGLWAILLGAFGAHGLEKWVDTKSLSTLEVGVRYQMYHALFLLFLGIERSLSKRQKKRIYLVVVMGILLFSCSLYLLAVNNLTAFDFSTIGFLTPIGGSFLIMGWLLAGYYVWIQKPAD